MHLPPILMWPDCQTLLPTHTATTTIVYKDLAIILLRLLLLRLPRLPQLRQRLLRRRLLRRRLLQRSCHYPATTASATTATATTATATTATATTATATTATATTATATTATKISPLFFDNNLACLSLYIQQYLQHFRWLHSWCSGLKQDSGFLMLEVWVPLWAWELHLNAPIRNYA